MKVRFEMGQRVRFRSRVDGDYNLSARAGTIGEVIGRSAGAVNIDYSVSVPGGVILVRHDLAKWILEILNEEMEK